MRVFADWLLQQGHPAGELVIVQLERLTHDSAALADREHDLFWNHVVPYMKTVLGRDGVTQFEWKRGLLHRVTLDHQGGEEALDATLRKLASDPCGRLVRRIEISAVQFDGAGDLQPALIELASLALTRLAELAIREGMNLGNPWIEGPIHIGDLTPIYHAYPQLQVLEIGGKECNFGTLDLPALRRLAIDDMTPVDLASVAAAPLPSLAELELFFGRWRVDNIDAVFRKLLDRAMPRLATLSIAAEIPQVMQYLVRAVPAAALSKHVRVLAFRRGALDDDCVRTLVQWAPRLRTLERLEVEGRALSPEHRRTLEQTFGRMLVLR
ncbi:MAG: hypothetical protein M4D80_37365 [Myxococcota bacterium]|nr:hypothetical protein [Deltaproteobacteria bacterium]MDQ3340862.1 hypothetical protein [Myxococcota bacterium]